MPNDYWGAVLSKPKKYTEIISHYENCFSKHGDTHLGADWPNMEDLETRYSVMLDVVREKSKNVSLLDFGCGSAMLYEFIKDRDPARNINYSGLDLGVNVINRCRDKYPDNLFYSQDILLENSLPKFDYIVANGVFTEKCSLKFDEMFEYFQKLVKTLFQHCNKGIAFNVMSKAVDWEREDLFHLSTDLLISFLTKEVSRHFIIRNDYGLYEYTVYIYR